MSGMLTDLIYRLRALFRKQRVEQEMQDELQYHLEREAEKYRASGASAEVAMRRARIALGGMEQARQQCRESRGTRLLEDLIQDLRFAARQLRNSPAFTATAIAVFALGIGASTTIFAFFDAALVKPLPYRDPARLVALFERIPVGDRYHLSYDDYVDWKRLNHVFTSLDVYTPNSFTLEAATGARRVSGARVSEGFFQTLGVTPFLGRDFKQGEGPPNTQPSVLLSYETWKNEYAANRNVLGHVVSLDGDPSIIIGVLPPSFHFAPVGSAGYWASLLWQPEYGRSGHPYYGVARLKPGVSVSKAYSDLTPIANEIALAYPHFSRDRSATVLPLADVIVGDIRPTLVALLGGAGLLSLIGFVNVASLLLVRAESRRREIALRLALGASFLRLIRQFCVEGFVLAGSGCVLGIALTLVALNILPRQIPAALLDGMPYLQGLHFNLHLVFFALAIGVLGGIFFSAAPTLQLFLSNVQAGLTEGGRAASGRSWRRAGAGLVVVELAITAVLLVSAGLLSKSFYRLLHEDIGIAPDHLAILHVSQMRDSTDDENVALARRIRREMAALPGLISVGEAYDSVLASGEGYVRTFAHFRVVGRTYIGMGDEASQHIVGVGYFETLRARLLRGRYFAESDDSTKPQVALINRTMAQQIFPGENPVGKAILNEFNNNHPFIIVGVVDDLKDGPLDTTPTAAVYVPFNQSPTSDFDVTLRATLSEAALLPTMVQVVHQMDATLIADHESTMSERIEDSPSAYLHRSAAWVVAGFAGLALLLGTVGSVWRCLVYGGPAQT